MKRPWTEKDIESALKMADHGFSYQDIAVRQRRGKSDVQHKIRSILGNRRKRYIWVAYDGEEVIAAATTVEDLAMVTKWKINTIYNREYRYRNGITNTKSVMKYRIDKEVMSIAGLGKDRD
jgi:hypothetical protein